MARKGFKALDELRGMLSVPPDTEATGYERAGYVTGLRAANISSYEPLVRRLQVALSLTALWVKPRTTTATQRDTV